MAVKNTVPNLEAKATDGNPVFTPRQWLERFRQFCKPEHKMVSHCYWKEKTWQIPDGPLKNKQYKKTSCGEWDRKHYIR